MIQAKGSSCNNAFLLDVKLAGVLDLTEPPRTDLAQNPFNPREELSDIEEMAASLTERGQIQPATVVRRQAFLVAHPGQEEELGKTVYVVVDGNRRLVAATVAGRAKIQAHINDSLSNSAANVLEPH